MWSCSWPWEQGAVGTRVLCLLQGKCALCASYHVVGGERDAASRTGNLPFAGRGHSCDCPTPLGWGKAEIAPWHCSSWRRTRSRRTGQESIILDRSAHAPHASVACLQVVSLWALCGFPPLLGPALPSETPDSHLPHFPSISHSHPVPVALSMWPLCSSGCCRKLLLTHTH